MEVPIKVLMVAFQQEGVRLPKREVLTPRPNYTSFEPRRSQWVPLSTWKPPSSGPFSRPPLVQASSNLSHVATSLGETLGNLPLSDYRYWKGAPNPASRFATCRACGIACYDGYLRKEHHDTPQKRCTTKMVVAINLIRKRHKCVICSIDTQQETWGVVLCSLKCQNEWRFGQGHSNPWLAALEQAEEILSSGPKKPPPEIVVATKEDMQRAIAQVAADIEAAERGIGRDY
jgi:hypothetical protein